MMQIDLPRLVVAAPHGRSGKTTVTIGLLTALGAAGYRVQAYKRGLDFIDPSWMTKITGRPCRNLDGYLMDRDTIRASLARSALNVDLAVVEGAMGLFDGVDLEGSGSTAEIAKTIQAPVLLVVDATRMTRSVAALVSGYQNFDAGVQVAGVILNKVARPRHEQMLRASIERYCGLPVLGVIPKGEQFHIPDRHLGLIPADEDDELAVRVSAAGAVVGNCLDLPGIVALAHKAGPVPVQQPLPAGPLLDKMNLASLRPQSPDCRVAVIMDRAFTFYYPENLEALVAAGAELVPVDALGDSDWPGVDGVYIGGGFPELFARELGANVVFRKQLRERIEAGLPVYAEGGGLLYLCRRLNWRDCTYPMLGVLPFEVQMTDKPRGHGYTSLVVENENPFYPTGAVIRGHEFHNSRILNLDGGTARFAFRVTRGYGFDGGQDGLTYKNVLGCYSHLHALSTPSWAPNLVAAACKYKTGGWRDRVWPQ